jgi:hypothetical protein
MGNALEQVIKGETKSVWPPPDYNIILAIPEDVHKSIRSRWPGESGYEPSENNSPRIYSRIAN